MAKSKIIKELANNQISMEVALQRLMIIASDLGLQTYALCKSIFLDLSILSKHFCFSPILYLYANSHVLCFVWRINRRKMAYVEKCIFFLCSYRLFQLTRSTLPFSSASFIHAVK